MTVTRQCIAEWLKHLSLDFARPASVAEIVSIWNPDHIAEAALPWSRYSTTLCTSIVHTKFQAYSKHSYPLYLPQLHPAIRPRIDPSRPCYLNSLFDLILESRYHLNGLRPPCHKSIHSLHRWSIIMILGNRRVEIRGASQETLVLHYRSRNAIVSA
jgi:hypothetical protein